MTTRPAGESTVDRPGQGFPGKASARLALGLTAVAAALGSLVTLGAAAKVTGSAMSLSRYTPAEVEDRLFGEPYMSSIRRIRRTTGLEETVFLVDAQSEDRGTRFSVLHALAPRRVVLLGSLRSEPLERLEARLPPDARWVVIIGDREAPPVLLSAAEFRAR